MDSTASNSQIYRAGRNDLIEGAENPALSADIPQPPKLVGHDVTLGFGYDLTTRSRIPWESWRILLRQALHSRCRRRSR